MTTMNDLLYPGNATDFFSRRPFPAFDPSTSAYCPANALWLAELSRLAYRHDHEEETPPPQPTQTGFLEKVGCTKRQFFLSHETNTQALLAEFGSATPFAVLAFRGTEQNIKDFIIDLTLGKINRTDGAINVHKGFKRALDSVWNDIETALKKIDCPIFFTGHSLGAALATLAAARHAPTALYTFGSPRVGDADFVASLKHITGIVHRVVDDQDIVATVPPEALGFQHIGTPHRLVDATARSISSPLDGLDAPPKFLADHAPVNYVDRL